MTDHHAEYEAAARLTAAMEQAEAMVADVRHMRDRYRLAARVAALRPLGVSIDYRNWRTWRRIAAANAKADALDGLLRKWATTYPCTACGEPIRAGRAGLDDHEQRVCASCIDELRGSYKPGGLA